MSKAFTRDENEGPDAEELAPLASPLPPGATNYITRAGADRLRDELAHLVETERPKLAGAAKGTESKQRLSILNNRIFQLEESLSSAQVISHDPGPAPRVTFGAMVTVRDEPGERSTYRIIGVDETDIERGWVSWVSPIARALMNSKAGQTVRFKSPSGEQRLEIVAIDYE